MEIKTEKAGIVIEKVVFDQVVEQSIDANFTLPEYMPEISRVLKCFSKPMILDKTVTGQTVTVDGDVLVNCIYSDTEGGIHNYCYTVPFRKSIDLPCTDKFFTEVKLKTNYLNYRPTGQRRIDIHGAVGICIKAIRTEEADVLSNVEGKSIEILKNVISYTEPITRIEKNLIIEEDLDFASDSQPIESIIDFETSAEIDDAKIISGKVIVKGTFNIHLLYVPKNAKRCQIYDTNIPFSSMLDKGGLDDDSQCNSTVTVCAVDIKEKKSLDSNTVGVTLEAKLTVAAELTEKKDIALITDGFSTLYDSEITFKDIEYSRFLGEINEHYICKKSIELGEGGLENAAEIKSAVTNETVSKEDGKIKISGTVTVYILGFDNEKNPVFYEKPLDFTYYFPFENLPENANLSSLCTISDTTYTLSGNDKVDIRADMIVSCKISALEKLSVISDIKIDENKKKNSPKDFQVAVYYGGTNESVWDIAKRYNTSPDSIIKANGLADEQLTAGKMLLIPCI